MGAAPVGFSPAFDALRVAGHDRLTQGADLALSLMRRHQGHAGPVDLAAPSCPPLVSAQLAGTS